MANVKVLVEGYLSEDNDGRTASTVSLVLDKNIVMVVDPGYLKDQKVLTDALKKEGFAPEDVNMVCITHSHIDHYKNVALFPKAKVLEYFGLWDTEGRMEEWQGNFTENIQILKTPGHDYTCITLFVKTDDGVVAICGDVFWKQDYPKMDIYATNLKDLEKSRKLVLEMSHWIIPGHSGMYKTANGHRLAGLPAGRQAKNGKKVPEEASGSCRKCHRAFKKPADRCFCQEWLCYRHCECEFDCNVCNCKRKQVGDIKHK